MARAARKATPAETKAEAPKKAAATKAVETTSAGGRGRSASEESQKRLDHILARTKEEPGVASPVLAGELDITTLQCSQLTDRLVKSGQIEIFKKANGVRMNFLPKDLAKQLPKLEKQREADLAAREANKGANAEKFAKLKEASAAKKAAAKAAEAPAEAKPARRRKAA